MFGRYTLLNRCLSSDAFHSVKIAPRSALALRRFWVSQQNQQRIERWAGSSGEEVKQVIRAVYRQVMGTTPDWRDFESLESLIDGSERQGFIRSLAMSLSQAVLYKVFSYRLLWNLPVSSNCSACSRKSS